MLGKGHGEMRMLRRAKNISLEEHLRSGRVRRAGKEGIRRLRWFVQGWRGKERTRIKKPRRENQEPREKIEGNIKGHIPNRSPPSTHV